MMGLDYYRRRLMELDEEILQFSDQIVPSETRRANSKHSVQKGNSAASLKRENPIVYPVVTYPTGFL